jgi:hypothetical protein
MCRSRRPPRVAIAEPDVLIGYDNEMTVEGPARGGVDREPVAGGLASVGACAWPHGHETPGYRLFRRQGNTRIPLIDRVSSLTSCCSTEVPNEPFASAVEWLWNLRLARERQTACRSIWDGRSLTSTRMTCNDDGFGFNQEYLRVSVRRSREGSTDGRYACGIATGPHRRERTP